MARGVKRGGDNADSKERGERENGRIQRSNVDGNSIQSVLTGRLTKEVEERGMIPHN